MGSLCGRCLYNRPIMQRNYFEQTFFCFGTWHALRAYGLAFAIHNNNSINMTPIEIGKCLQVCSRVPISIAVLTSNICGYSQSKKKVKYIWVHSHKLDSTHIITRLLSSLVNIHICMGDYIVAVINMDSRHWILTPYKYKICMCVKCVLWSFCFANCVYTKQVTANEWFIVYTKICICSP